MKIAICLSGQLRTVERAAPNIIKFIGELSSDVDLFIRTWDINSTTPMFDELSPYNYPYTKIPSYNLKNIFSPLKVQRIEKQDYIHFFGNLCNIPNNNRITVFPLFYTWLRSVRLATEHAKNNNIEYDIMIKIRPDVIYHSGLKLIDYINNYQLENNKSLFLSNFTWQEADGKRTTDDIVFMSTPHTMLRAASGWWKKYCSLDVGHSQDSGNMHSQFLSYLKSLSIEVKGFNDLATVSEIYNPVAILRPECRYDPIDEYDKCWAFDRIYYWGGFDNSHILSLFDKYELISDIEYVLSIRNHVMESFREFITK